MYGHKWFLKIGELSDGSILGLMNDANELIHCSFSFNQGIDFKGQTQTEVRTGGLIVTYDGLPSKEIIDWAMSSRKLHDGVLVLCDTDDKPLNKVFFEDAACVELSVNYMNDGKSSIITQLRLYPRVTKIDDETLTKHWANTSFLSSTKASSSNANKVQSFKLAQPIGKISLSLIIDANTYEIEKFRMDMSQGVDQKGEPQEDTNGGVLEFSIANFPDKLFSKWMMKETEIKNGVFVFEQGDQSSPLKVKFTDAYCVNMVNRTSLGKGVFTDYVISVNELDLNGKWLYKNFNL